MHLGGYAIFTTGILNPLLYLPTQSAFDPHWLVDGANFDPCFCGEKCDPKFQGHKKVKYGEKCRLLKLNTLQMYGTWTFCQSKVLVMRVLSISENLGNCGHTWSFRAKAPSKAVMNELDLERFFRLKLFNILTRGSWPLVFDDVGFISTFG